MSDGKKWVKWWCDAANDPKVLSVPYDCRWAFPSLLLLAKKSEREGYLEMTPGKPYSDEALAKWCDMPCNALVTACNALCNAGILESVTEGNVTSLKFTKWERRQKSDSLERVRRFRAKRVTACNVTKSEGVTVPVTTEVEVDVEVDVEKTRSKTIVTRPGNGRFTPPTIDQVSEYCQARNNSVDPVKWYAYYVSNGWRVGKNPMKSWKAAIVTWEKN